MVKRCKCELILLRYMVCTLTSHSSSSMTLFTVTGTTGEFSFPLFTFPFTHLSL
jgi:hypothetical protein